MSYVLASALAFAAMFGYISASPFIIEDVFGQSPQVFSLFFAVNALGIVVMSQVSGLLVRRVPPVRILLAGLVIAATGGVMLILAAVAGLGLFGIAVGFFMVVSSYGLVAPNAAALALADQPHQAGSASALLGATQFLVGAAAAPLVSLGGTTSAVPMALSSAASRGSPWARSWCCIARTARRRSRGPCRRPALRAAGSQGPRPPAAPRR